MTRSELRDHFNEVCAYFLVELGKHLVNAFEECCDELEDLDDIGEILPWSIMWEDSKPSVLTLRVSDNEGKQRRYAPLN